MPASFIIAENDSDIQSFNKLKDKWDPKEGVIDKVPQYLPKATGAPLKYVFRYDVVDGIAQFRITIEDAKMADELFGIYEILISQ